MDSVFCSESYINMPIMLSSAFSLKSAKNMLVFPNYAKKCASTIEKSLSTSCTNIVYIMLWFIRNEKELKWNGDMPLTINMRNIGRRILHLLRAPGMILIRYCSSASRWSKASESITINQSVSRGHYHVMCTSDMRGVFSRKITKRSSVQK